MTLAQLRTALQARGYGSDTAVAQAEILNGVYREIAGERRWAWLETTATGAMTANQGKSALPAGVLVVGVDRITVRQVGGTDQWDLEYLDPRELRQLQARDGVGLGSGQILTGAPEYWTIQGGQLCWWPIPDKAYPFDIDHVQDPPDLTADGDTPLLPATYHDVLVWGAILEMAGRERDPQMQALAQRRYDAKLTAMRAKDGSRQRSNSTRVRESGFYRER